MVKVAFKKLSKSRTIDDFANVKVTKMGHHYVEVVHVERKSETLLNYVKLNKDTYAIIDRNTGEIVEEKNYKLNDNRGQNTASLKQTFKRIRDLINNNFMGDGAFNELFITLTYRFVEGKPMTDVKTASADL